jgi:hypothetical protein
MGLHGLLQGYLYFYLYQKLIVIPYRVYLGRVDYVAGRLACPKQKRSNPRPVSAACYIYLKNLTVDQLLKKLSAI